MATTDDIELEVVYRMLRKSGASTYVLNTPKRNTVFHSRHGPLTCMDPTCAATFDERDPKTHKGCKHTRAALRYEREHPEGDDDEAIEHAGAHDATNDPEDVAEEYL